MTSTVYWILNAVYWLPRYWADALNWNGQMGHMQFIGSVGHYFAPGLHSWTRKVGNIVQKMTSRVCDWKCITFCHYQACLIQTSTLTSTWNTRTLRQRRTWEQQEVVQNITWKENSICGTKIGSWKIGDINDRVLKSLFFMPRLFSFSKSKINQGCFFLVNNLTNTVVQK